ncbi:type II toxin-antitoxin system RelE/ParE family toxin [Ciceribacter sp. L1K22]|uniref:type II toxin-antitoxin system RelE/ParE family toxin n=1 Tax=Ciceribacter sp. L1K22 TaxID=2820275 RepID=UPI001ABDA4B9|nr:type II toxin-antitoxin system RelE/ParE family toxin [Ciceribacter sp. L1K22]MBO3761112.1 type II toxin-antitoxin system RelE/ParE family toxin [Ciceribacter sp. L1K22]
MRLRYLATAEPGLRWLRSYYKSNPQLNRDAMLGSLKKAEQMLRDFPESGETFEDFLRVREYHVGGTPFSLLYTIADDCVWIIDVRDTRGQRSADVLRRFMRELHVKFERD